MIYMKRMILLALCVLAAAGAAFSQTASPPNSGPGSAPEPVKISGNLGITGGMISLESGGSLYYVTGLDRFFGFIDGLKEGAAVSLTGYAFDSPRGSGTKMFRVTQLDLNGKSYDLAPPAEEFRGPGNGPRPMGGFSPGGNSRSFEERRGKASGHHHRGGQERRGPGPRN
ncbi:MAG: hypothetical protein LBP93_05550 [Treponema sp.]|jgi:hypothetical protein|nr:hypothetical protein [Treponema sp.]